MIATGAVVATLALDTVSGEPPARIHPVALFGRVVERLDRDWRRPRVVGFAIAIVLPLVVALSLGALTRLAHTVDPIIAGAVATAVLFATTSLRSLLAAATAVIDAAEDDHATEDGPAAEADLDAARTASLALVGRDTDDLSAPHLRSGAVESAAENLADGLVAPLAAFAIGTAVSLPFGVAAAAFVKAVNTLDSMLGYRDRPVGWASARLDDVVMWLPARASALLIAIVATLARSPPGIRSLRSWAGRPSSPNSGWPMATLAGALDVRLEKRGAYALNETANLPTTADARRGVRIVGVAGVASFAVAGVVAWF